MKVSVVPKNELQNCIDQIEQQMQIITVQTPGPNVRKLSTAVIYKFS